MMARFLKKTLRFKQRDQIERFLEVLANKFSYKRTPNFW